MPAVPHEFLRSTIVATLLGLGACAQASAPPGGMGVAFRETGTFRFEVRARGEVITEGWLNVTHDTIIVRATPGPCYYDRESRASVRIVYRCSDRRFTFDRRRPISRASVTYPRRVVTTRRVCGAWAVNARGVNVCTRYVRETEESFVPTSLPLEPIRQ